MVRFWFVGWVDMNGISITITITIDMNGISITITVTTTYSQPPAIPSPASSI